MFIYVVSEVSGICPLEHIHLILVIHNQQEWNYSILYIIKYYVDLSMSYLGKKGNDVVLQCCY